MTDRPALFVTRWPPTMRLAVLFCLLFAISTLLLFGFIYWQSSVTETDRVGRLLVRDAVALSRLTGQSLRDNLESRVTPSLRPIAYSGLFSGDRAVLAGNLSQFPAGLPADGAPHRVTVPLAVGSDSILAVGLVMESGTILVIGRDIESIDNIRLVVLHALELGLIPAILLALFTGILVSQRTRRKLQEVHETADRIIKGDLRERLPVRGGGDDFDRLAASVNHMLDLIARLMDDMKSVGDNIAHDLRTPLTRVRTRLERARETAASQEDWHAMVDRAVAGLDQALRLITALLRIGEIEGGRRRAAFQPLNLEELAREIAELYEPFAEEKGLTLIHRLQKVAHISGDRDLLCELLSNLVDNAIKFSPPGGSIVIALQSSPQEIALTVADSGPGIPAEQRDAVFQRFYRSDASRSIEGYGLGLSLVDAIAKLHGFRLAISDNHPGCVMHLFCRSAEPT